MTSAPIALDHVAKRFGALTALDDVGLTIEAGEFLALAGHNGAGKTTLFKIVLGLLKPSGGTVSVFGGEPGRAEALSAIGFLPENVVFTGNTTGRELLRFYASLKNAPRRQCDELLEQVGSPPPPRGASKPIPRACGNAWGSRRCSWGNHDCSFSTSRRPGSTPSRAGTSTS